MDYRRVGIAIAASHFVRSLSGWDLQPDLALEITLFRAEVSKAESTIQRTTVILEHCNSYSNFLTYILKLLALSEVLLLLWIVYLVVSRKTVVIRQPQVTDQAGCDSSSLISTDSSDLSPVQAVSNRFGPTRPSDLKRVQKKD